MNFNLVEMYNGLLRFNKHILNELAEGLKHLPNLDGVSKGDSLIINELRFGPYFVPNKVGTNKKADYNWIRGNNGQDTDKAIRVLLLGGRPARGSSAGSGDFGSYWVWSDFVAHVGFFTTVKLD
jgi:hypothetical protein